MRLHEQAALVTGGRQGIGRAIVDSFISEGADVMTCGRASRPADLSSIVGWTQTDLTNQDDIEELSFLALDRFGGLDILVNNAGGQFPQAAADYSPNGWRTIIDLNLNGTWNMTQAIGKQMLNGQGGVICNITMTVGRGNPGIAHSGAARAGVGELTRSLVETRE